jgi:hypothetical protein
MLFAQVGLKPVPMPGSKSVLQLLDFTPVPDLPTGLIFLNAFGISSQKRGCIPPSLPSSPVLLPQMRFLILSLAIGALIFTFPTGHFF